jgi:hypothetical protein
MPIEQRHGRPKPLCVRPSAHKQCVYLVGEPTRDDNLDQQTELHGVKRGEGVARRCNSRARFALGYHGGVRRNETGVLLGAALLAARRQQQKQ